MVEQWAEHETIKTRLVIMGLWSRSLIRPELIQMDIHEYQSLLKTELIKNIQIHLYNGKEMVFHNTVLYETAKLLPPNLTPIFVTHSHPQNALAAPPFCILNQTHIKSSTDTFKLITTLLQLAQQSEEERREGRPQL